MIVGKLSVLLSGHMAPSYRPVLGLRGLVPWLSRVCRTLSTIVPCSDVSLDRSRCNTAFAHFRSSSLSSALTFRIARIGRFGLLEKPECIAGFAYFRTLQR